MSIFNETYFDLWAGNDDTANYMIKSVRFNIILALSIQLSKSASLRRGGGLVTPGSRVNVVGMNCNINSSVINTYFWTEMQFHTVHPKPMDYIKKYIEKGSKNFC